MPNLNEHNDVKKLWRPIQEGQLPAVGLELVDVYHDDWCAIHHGRFGNCDPDIHIRHLSLRDPERN